MRIQSLMRYKDNKSTDEKVEKAERIYNLIGIDLDDEDDNPHDNQEEEQRQKFLSSWSVLDLG